MAGPKENKAKESKSKGTKDEKQGIFQQMTEMATKYGAAWFIVIQVLGWITFFVIYGLVRYSGVDVAAFLKQRSFSDDIVRLAETGGLFALSFALNRLLMPVRLVASGLLMPVVAKPINNAVEPYMKYFTGEIKPKNE